jgi:hypothetical protein
MATSLFTGWVNAEMELLTQAQIIESTAAAKPTETVVDTAVQLAVAQSKEDTVVTVRAAKSPLDVERDIERLLKGSLAEHLVKAADIVVSHCADCAGSPDVGYTG